MKIAIYTIAKNEQQHVERWANSNKEADVRLVCDTGSTDDTVNLLKSQGVKVFNITINPWRFDVARNAALNLLPADIDVCIWQDLDEELLPGWREEIEKHWTANTTIANHRYRNNNNPWQWHSKIHARHNCRWVGPVHETLEWSVPEQSIWLKELYLDEHQDTTKDRKSYLNLLLKKIQEGDTNWRTYYFLANDYQTVGDLSSAIESRVKSYNACTEGPIVKSYIARNIAKNYVEAGQNSVAERWFNVSVDQSNEREAWFSYAEYCNKIEDWERCYLYAKRCIGVTTKRDGFTYDDRAWGAEAYDLAALSAYHIGLRSAAITYGEQALIIAPENVRLQNNLKFYKEETE